MASSFHCLTGAGMIDQDLSHQVSRYAVELRPIRAIRRPTAEAQVGFMHQRRRL